MEGGREGGQMEEVQRIEKAWDGFKMQRDKMQGKGK